MKYLCVTLLVCAMVAKSMGYCYFEEQKDGASMCVAEGGLAIPPTRQQFKLPGRCMKCSCKGLAPGKLVMDCCATGVDAVKLPSGCTVERMEDGCTMKPGSFKCKRAY